MTTAVLTPTTNTTPAVANIVDELSGAQWVARFPGDNTTDTLTADFKVACDAFIAAIEDAGGTVQIDSTLRPPKRACLMHWSHKIFRNDLPATSVPAMEGVHINWVHPTAAASKEAARQMVYAFPIQNLAANVPPSLETLHTKGEAIDMRIAWAGTLTIAKKDGTTIAITTEPRTGMNVQLKAVGLTYGVKKFIGGNGDRPHWSTTGH